MDPKIFRADKTWLVVCVGCSRLLNACLDSITTCTPALAHAATAACRVAATFLDGSRSLGLKEKEGAMNHELVTGDKSLYSSAASLSSTSLLKAYPALKAAATKLAQVIKPATTLAIDPMPEDDEDDDDDEDVKPGRRNSTGRVARAGSITGLQVHNYSAILKDIYSLYLYLS